jgi:hypothetical protein
MPLPELLTHIVEELTRNRDGRRPVATVEVAPLERYEDKEFIYLEAGLDREPGPDIDICIHAGRAFIRMERSLVE